MKHFVFIGVVLAAAQCLPGSGSENQKESESEDVGVTVDAGTDDEAPDAGGGTVDAAAAIGALEPGPPPFDVPTRRIELPGLSATMLVPVGTTAERGADSLQVKLGEGKNFWVEVSDAATDLSEARALVDSETAELVDRYEDAVLWNEGDFWFFQYSDTLSCSNPIEARHDLRNVELMIAACRSIEDSGSADVPAADDETPKGENEQ